MVKFCLVWGIGVPLLGTVLGSALALLVKWDAPAPKRMFSGAAAGIMAGAAIFGLFLPALEQSWLAALGAALGVCFLLLPARLMGKRGSRGWLIVLAVVLHNIPEGLAAGVSFGSWLTGAGVGSSEALTVGLGIGLQNLPDGAMVTLPLRQQGMGRGKAFALGALSGLVEPVAAVCMLRWAADLLPILPLLMGFAGGAMVYVAAAELIPAMEVQKGKYSGLACFVIALLGVLLIM